MSPFIKTVDQLRDFMRMVAIACEPLEPVTDDELKWFVCICEAENHSENTLKDTAYMFLYGVTAITTLEQVQDYIDTIYECAEEEDAQMFNDTCLRASVYRFYGQHDTAQTLMDSIHDMSVDF